jgi:hypothetical protein
MIGFQQVIGTTVFGGKFIWLKNNFKIASNKKSHIAFDYVAFL